ncbi:cytochrome P450 [Nostoc sp. FACHB-110]|uniref:cytochrome P450 n=1 Tax=Nostoc sp. FACHB-110 TaxID=2692834 RepID=UPI001682F7FF|nr:cytochrome P450 [Nostoc sp. FACHB-110]MBD2440395.1 cytochrome P450 [Nostoc sp. FACHB-110]
MPLPNYLPMPSFIQKYQWIVDPIAYMENAAQKYPDIFTGEIVSFGNTVVFVNHPKGIQEVLNNDRKKFVAAGELNKILQPLAGENSILMLDGNRHKWRRQLVMPSFHGDRLKAYGQQISNITEKIFAQLPVNQTFLARTVFQEISLQVILQTVFGLYEGERFQILRHLLGLLMDVFNSAMSSSLLLFPVLQQNLGAWSPWGKFIRLRQQIDEFLYAEIAKSRKQSNPDRIDILSLLISAKDETGEQMTDAELRDELITLLLAGHETTATSMAWALYWIHRQPEVLEKLLQELDAVGDSPDVTIIARLPYLTAVCNETLRMCPPVMLTFPRIVQEPVDLLGHRLETGTVVAGCIYLAHHREDLYPEPQKFKPERFLERQFSPFEFMPFGGGVRVCIGQALALFEMKLVLAKVLSSYQLTLGTRRPEKAGRRTISLAPARGVKMLITGIREHRKLVCQS